METKNCYHELPEGYELVREIDAVKNKKVAVLLNVVGALLMLIAGSVVFLLKIVCLGKDISDTYLIPVNAEPIWQAEFFLAVLVVGMLVYMVLHELTHGVAYKILTHEKLTFGLTLSCAYCGVPNVYVNRKTALIALLAPFTLFSVLFLAVGFLTDGWVSTLSLILFAAHFGGCSGDLYDTLLFLTSLRGDILMKDTGPKQSFYRRKED